MVSVKASVFYALREIRGMAWGLGLRDRGLEFRT